ncbi:MAG: S8 family serine peptidase [Propionibacteriales bacterium]|nr:S8 family serine peptidase [Propionibacteriales bacterium]
MTGTSQATPIVAGGAALLRQQHPDWTWQQVKAQLVTTADAHPTSMSWTVGGGRLDLAQATSQTLSADKASLDFGLFRHPDEAPRSKAVTLSNDGDEPVSVALVDEVLAENGAAAPDDAVIASPATFTVPAHGTASSTVTFDPGLVADGSWHGSLTVAAGEQALVRLPFGAHDEEERYDVHLRAIDRVGEPVASGLVTMVNGDTGGYANVALDAEGAARVRLPPGHWSALSRIVTPARGGVPETFTIAGTTELDVSADTTYVVDAREAEQVRAPTVYRTGTEVVLSGLSWARRGPSSGITDFAGFTAEEIAQGRVFVATGPPVEHGLFEAVARWTLQPTGEVGPADPGVYELLLPRPAFSAALWPQLSPKDLHDMARVDNHFAAVSQPGEYVTGRGYFTEKTRTALITFRPLDVPQHRVELVTAAPDVYWRQCLRLPTLDRFLLASLCDPDHRTYDRAERAESTWAVGLHPAVVQTRRSATTMYVQTGLSDGPHSGALVDGFDREQTNVTLFRDGELVGERAGVSGSFTVPKGPATYRVEQVLTIDPADLAAPARARTVWEFGSDGPVPGGPSQVHPPLLSLDYRPDVDDLGAAKARRALRLDLRVGHHADADRKPAIAAATVSYSTDAGASWRQAPGRRVGDGRYVITVPGHALVSGDSISLRARASDADGNSIDQTLVGTIPVR